MGDEIDRENELEKNLASDADSIKGLMNQLDPAGEKIEQRPSEEIEEVIPSQETELKPDSDSPEPPVGDLTPPVGGSGTPPEETPPTLPEVDAELEAELAQIRAHKGATPKTQKALDVLKDKIRKERLKVKERETELAEARKVKPLDEPTEKELGDLRKLRAQVAIDQDPEFNQRYTQPIIQHQNDAVNLLRQWKLPEETAKYINDNGGLLRFQASSELMPEQVKDAQGNPITRSQWWHNVVKPMLSDAQKDELGDHLSEARKAIRTRDTAVKEAKGDPEKFFAQRKQEFETAVKKYQEEADQQAQTELTLYGEIAKPKTIPANATTEQKAELEKHNARLEEARQDVVKWFQDNSPKGRMSQALARAYRDFAMKHVEEVDKNYKVLETKFTELQQKWDNMKNAAQTSRQQSVVQTPTKPKQEGRPADDGEAIKQLMAAVPA